MSFLDLFIRRKYQIVIEIDVKRDYDIESLGELFAQVLEAEDMGGLIYVNEVRSYLNGTNFKGRPK